MPTASAQTNARNDRLITLAVCILLTALIWIVFGQTLRHGFINFDDDAYIYENSHISAGLTLDGFKWMLTHSHANLWHPLTTLSHMADCQIFGLKPAGHHFVNVLLHNIAALLLFFLLRAMTGAIWESAFVAAIFAIHPMRVESVAWAAERKDVLSGVFFMLTLGAYFYYTRKPSALRYVTMSIFLVCGLMSKATFVTVPIVLLLVDYWPRFAGANSTAGRREREDANRRREAGASVRDTEGKDFREWRKLIVEKIPLFILCGLAALATVFWQTVTMPTLEQLSLLARLKNAAVSLVIYLRQMFWPADLAIFYPHPHDQLNLWVVIACAVLIVAITVVAILVRKKHPYVFVGWFWFLILIAPVTGILQAGLQGRADRFTYLPHIGVTILVAWSAADLTRGWRNREVILGSVAGVVIVALAGLAFKQTTYWRDSVSVWRHALAVTPDNQMAHQNLASALWVAGKTDESHRESRAAAIAHARTTLKDFPFDLATHNDLGVLMLQNGDVRGAIEQWETSLQIDPDNGNALNNLAWVLATYPDDRIRNGKRAVELATKAAALPGGISPIVLRTVAAAYAEAGDFANAIATAKRAVDLANMQRESSLAATLRHELELYQAQSPYRETPPQ
jgi:protein O-mannosyl-transferase